MTNKELIGILRLYDPDDDVLVMGDKDDGAYGIETVYHVPYECGSGDEGPNHVVLSVQPTVDGREELTAPEDSDA